MLGATVAEQIALVSVVGSIILGLAGIAAAFFAPTWSQRQVEKRREGREFREAQRLVAQELHRFSIEAKVVAKAPVAFPPEIARFFGDKEWAEHKGTLGRLLDDDVWNLVRDVYTHLDQLHAALGTAPGQPLKEDEALLLKHIAQRAEKARNALADAKPNLD